MFISSDATDTTIGITLQAGSGLVGTMNTIAIGAGQNVSIVNSAGWRVTLSSSENLIGTMNTIAIGGGATTSIVNSAGWIMSVANTQTAINIINSAGWLMSVANTQTAINIINSAGWLVNVANTATNVNVINSAGWSFNQVNTAGQTVNVINTAGWVTTPYAAVGATTSGYGNFYSTANTALLAAPTGANRIYITSVSASNKGGVDTQIDFKNGTTIVLSFFMASSGGGATHTMPIPIRLDSQSAFQAALTVAGSAVASCQGWIGL